MKRILFVTIIIFTVSFLRAEFTGVAFQETDITIGARAQSLASAFTGAADDSTSVFWNPAGLSKVRYSEAILSYSSWFLDTSIQYATGALNIGSKNSIGFGIVYINMGEIEEIDENFRPHKDQPVSGEFLDAALAALQLEYDYSWTFVTLLKVEYLKHHNL